MTKLIYPMSHILKASHGWQPQEIKYTFWRATAGERESFHLSFLELRAQLNLVQFRNRKHNPSLPAAQWHLPSCCEFEWNNLPTLNEAVEILPQFLCFIMQEAILRMLPQLCCLLCGRVCLLQVLSLPLILTHVGVFLALSHSRGRAQGYCRNTSFLHPSLTCSHFKRSLCEHISCSWNCFIEIQNWTIKMYSWPQH